MEGTELSTMPPVVWDRIAFYRRTARLMRYLSEHPDRHLSLQQASSIACMERTAFSRFFKQRIGVGFSEFMGAYRVDLAKRYMIRSNASLQEISRAVGFNCMATFERRFKRQVGMTPSAYRSEELRRRRLSGPAERPTGTRAPVYPRPLRRSVVGA